MASSIELTTLQEVWKSFRGSSSPRVMAVGLLIVACLRCAVAVSDASSGRGVGGLTVWDLVAAMVVVVAAPLTEWAIHLLILHRKPFMVAGRVVDLSAAHRQHHENPSHLEQVLLRGDFAVGAQLANGLLAVIVVGPILWLGGLRSSQELAGPLGSAILVALLALLHYEWAHLMFHTGYRPRTRYYRRLKSNHRLHHYRNEHYWLGITSNAADRVMFTYPSSRSAVPVSATARTLGVDPEAGPNQ